MGRFASLMEERMFESGFNLEDMKLKIGAYYPFVMKNGSGNHKCIGYVASNGIYVTNMTVCYSKEDVLWYGTELHIKFPPEFGEKKYL